MTGHMMILVIWLVMWQNSHCTYDKTNDWIGYDWSYYDIGHMNGHVAKYSLNE